RMRQERNADPELLDLRRALENRAGHAAPVQIKRERQAADPTPDDRDFHAVRSPSAASRKTYPSRGRAVKVRTRARKRGRRCGRHWFLWTVCALGAPRRVGHLARVRTFC